MKRARSARFCAGARDITLATARSIDHVSIGRERMRVTVVSLPDRDLLG